MNFNTLMRCVIPVLLPVITLTQVGCGAAPNDSPVATTAKQGADAQIPARDGETIFRGVFFGQGPVASLFPETWGNGAHNVPMNGAPTNDALTTAITAELSWMQAHGSPNTAISRLESVRDRLQNGSLDATTLASSGEYDSVVTDAKIARLMAAMRTTDPTFFDSFGADVQSGDHIRVQSAIQRARNGILSAAEGSDFSMPAGSMQGDCAVLILAVVALIYFWTGHPVHPTATGLEDDEYVDLIATRLSTT